MQRKMVWLGLPWLVGLYVATACTISVTVGLLLAAFALSGAFRLLRRMTTAQALCVSISATLAVGAVLGYTAICCKPIQAYAGRTNTFFGKVVSVTLYDNDRASYQVKGAFSDGTRAKILVYTDDVGAQYGDLLDVAGEFDTPNSTYLWNGESYYRAKGIFLEASSDAFVRCTHTENGKLIRMLQSYRNRISTRICTLAGTDAGGLVSAMLLGTKDTVDDETDNLLTHNGIQHIVSVSGLHLVLILSVWGWICRRLRMHRYVCFGTTALWTVLYALLVGAPIPMLRAGLMYLLVQSAPLFFRKADTCNSLCVAGMVLTIGNPYLIQDASFLLSFVGTFGIGVFAPWMTKKMYLHRKGLAWYLLRQLANGTCVFACIFPVTLLYFREVSVASPIANLLLVPICTGMLVLSLGIFLTGGIGLIAKPICLLLKLLYDVMLVLAYGLQDVVPYLFPTGWKLLPILSCVLILFVLAVLLSSKRNRQRSVALAILLSFGIVLGGQTTYRMTQRQRFTVVVLGQRQEEVLLICYAGKTDVIDLTGNHRNPKYVWAYCAAQGITKLDTLSLTKRADQMRVTYSQVLSEMTVAETTVPTSCIMPSDRTFMETTPIQTDEIVITDAQYTIRVADGVAWVTFGNLCFGVGKNVSELPQMPVTALICTKWSGEAENMPEYVYKKDDAMQIRVYSDGSWELEQLE